MRPVAHRLVGWPTDRWASTLGQQPVTVDVENIGHRLQSFGTWDSAQPIVFEAGKVRKVHFDQLSELTLGQFLFLSNGPDELAELLRHVGTFKECKL